jgi:5-enolpyruvylshikimate-3-phosphate synthase
MPALLSSKTSSTVRDHRLAVVLQVIAEHFGEITRVRAIHNFSLVFILFFFAIGCCARFNEY